MGVRRRAGRLTLGWRKKGRRGFAGRRSLTGNLTGGGRDAGVTVSPTRRAPMLAHSRLAPSSARPVTFHPTFAPHLELFHCDRLRADLSPASCAETYASGRLLGCSGCRIGHLHATQSGLISSNAPPRRSELEGAKCTRCERGAPRLIHWRLCPSCFNREREYLRGWNAKGTKPQKLGLRTGEAVLADDSPPRAGGIAVEQIEDDVWLLGVHVVDEAELVRAISAIAPVGEVLDTCVTPFRELAVQQSCVRRPRQKAFGSLLNDRSPRFPRHK